MLPDQTPQDPTDRPQPQENAQGPTPEIQYPGLQLAQLNLWREDQANWIGWRYDSAIDEEYNDGNQFSDGDRAAMAAKGIPMVTINRIKRQINDVIGLQESNMTDFKLHTEDVQQQDTVDALAARLKIAERMSGCDRGCLDAFKSMVTAGIGWVEIGTESNPFKYKHRVSHVPWREIYWDYRGTRNLDMSDASHVRRIRFYSLDQLLMAFPNSQEDIRNAQWNTDQYRNWIEPSRQQRDYSKSNWRDVPTSWNTSYAQQKDMRCVEEVWYQVQIRGAVVRFANGKVMAYESAQTNPMAQLAIQAGEAEIMENQVYPRWRQSFWIADRRLMDRWSPLAFDGPPYVPFWCYREAMTGVPYGLVRVMRSIQDAINTMEAKIIFSINAKQTKVKSGAASLEMIQTQVGQKNGIIVINDGYSMDDVQINDHIALNEQHFKLYADLCQQIEAVSGIAGLNPAAMSSGKPRSGELAAQMTMRAMASIGEPSANYRASRTIVGQKLMAQVKAEIAQGNGTDVELKRRDGIKRTVRLHGRTVAATGEQMVTNDVTLLNENVVLEEVPHTATFRAQQFEVISNVLQSMPPEAVQVRSVMLANLVECSDLPHAAEDAQMLREQMHLIPPSTPEAQAAADQQQKEQQAAKQLAVQEQVAKVRHLNTKADKDEASAAKLQAETHRVATGGDQPPAQPQEDPTTTLLNQMKSAEQIAQTRAKTAKVLHETESVAQDNNAKAVPQTW